MIKEISFGQFIDLSKRQTETLTEAALIKVLRCITRKAVGQTITAEAGFISCHSRKLKTLGCNETTVTQKGEAFIIYTYKDATNKSETKYYKLNRG